MAAYVGIFESADTAKTLAAKLSEQGVRSEEIAVFAPGDDTTSPQAQDFLSGIEKRASAAMEAGDTVMVARAAFGMGSVIENGFEEAKPKRSFAKSGKYLRHASELIGLPILSPRRPMGWLPTGTFTDSVPLSVRGHIDPVFPHTTKGHMDPVLPHSAKGHMDPVFPHLKRGRDHLKKGHVDPLFPHAAKGQMDPVLPHLKKGHMDPVLPHLKKGHMDPVLPHLKKGQVDPVLPHLKKGHMDPILPLVTKDRFHLSSILPLLWPRR